jgi:hypothetical protein
MERMAARYFGYFGLLKFRAIVHQITVTVSLLNSTLNYLPARVPFTQRNVYPVELVALRHVTTANHVGTAPPIVSLRTILS